MLNVRSMNSKTWDELAEHTNFNLEIDLDGLASELSRDAKILDFGCGYGRISHLLNSRGFSDVQGVDPSKKMIERGSREYPELHLEHQSDLGIPFPDNQFDAVVSCAVFTCITSDRDRILSIEEILRVLKPQGLFHLVEFSSDDDQVFTSSFGAEMRHSPPEKLRRLIDGFSINREEVLETRNMNGNLARCFRVFANKTFNKQIKQGQG